jgi:superfamily II DNA or RNA helicase
MKNYKDTVLTITDKDLEVHSEEIEKLSSQKTVVAYINKTNENKIEIFWQKSLDNIIHIRKIENHFKDKYAVINPNSRFIKKSMNRNINTTKYFFRVNKKSDVIDIGFFSKFIKELKIQVDGTDKIASKYIQDTLWLIDKSCMDEFHKQYEEEYIKEWLENNSEQLQYNPYDHQLKAFVEALKYKKRLIKSPTGSGKAFIISLLWHFYKSHHKKIKTLIIVPAVQLLNQLEEEIKMHFPETKFLKIGGDNMTVFGINKDEYIDINKSKFDIVISTYQSLPVSKPENDHRADISENVKKFLGSFGNKNKGLIIIDEVHKAKAKTIQEIMKAMNKCEFRIGLTGTIANALDNKWDLYQLYSKFRYQHVDVIGITELEKRNVLTPIDFHFNIMNIYDETDVANYMVNAQLNEIQKQNSDIVERMYENILPNAKKIKLSYQEEVDLVVNSEKRRDVLYEQIKKVYDGKKNVLVFFNRTHIGEQLYYLTKNEKIPTYIITKDISHKLRENIKNKIEKEQGIITYASYGTSGTGINFKNVEICHFVEMKKSDIIIFQTLGRMQRTLEGKDKADVYFHIDKFDHYNNYLYNHFNIAIKSLKREFGEDRIKKAMDEINILTKQS